MKRKPARYTAAEFSSAWDAVIGNRTTIDLLTLGRILDRLTENRKRPRRPVNEWSFDFVEKKSRRRR